jgi:hypothetical protein
MDNWIYFLLCNPLAFQTCSGSGGVIQTPPKTGRTVRDIRRPTFVRAGGGEVLIKQVVRYRVFGVTLCCDLKRGLETSPKAGNTHQASHFVATARVALFVQVIFTAPYTPSLSLWICRISFIKSRSVFARWLSGRIRHA